MVQKGQTRIERRLQRYDQHPRRCKRQVEHDDRGQQEEQDSEQDRAQEQLVEVIIARVDSIAQDVPFLAPEQVEKGDDYGELPVEDARRGDVEGVDMDSENGEQVGEERNRHACAGETGASNYIYYVRKVGL